MSPASLTTTRSVSVPASKRPATIAPGFAPAANGARVREGRRAGVRPGEERDRAVGGVGDGDVRIGVAVELPDDDRGGVVAGRQRVALDESPEQHGAPDRHGLGGSVEHGEVGAVAAVEVPVGHDRRRADVLDGRVEARHKPHGRSRGRGGDEGDAEESEKCEGQPDSKHEREATAGRSQNAYKRFAPDPKRDCVGGPLVGSRDMGLTRRALLRDGGVLALAVFAAGRVGVGDIAVELPPRGAGVPDRARNGDPARARRPVRPRAARGRRRRRGRRRMRRGDRRAARRVRATRPGSTRVARSRTGPVRHQPLRAVPRRSTPTRRRPGGCGSRAPAGERSSSSTAR